jgi:hypothetical protein
MNFSELQANAVFAEKARYPNAKEGEHQRFYQTHRAG